MRLTERRLDHAVVLELTGPVAGRQATDRLDAAVRRQAHACTLFVVADLARVPSVDLGGLGSFLDAHMTIRHAGGVFRLVCANRRIRDLLAVTRLFQVIETFDSVEEAIDAVVAETCGTPQDWRLRTVALAPILRFLRRAW